MKKSRFSEAQIVGVLKEVVLGAKVVETSRKHDISEPTYYKWKSQLAGMTVTDSSTGCQNFSSPGRAPESGVKVEQLPLSILSTLF